jgi:superfamily II DNA helicase RecQ
MPKKQRTFSVESVSEISHPKLFERLRSWRSVKAKETNMPPYVIFSQKALYGLTQYLPTDRKSLLQISGIGQAKVEQYGSDIIRIIKTYCEETEIYPSQIKLK